MSAMDQQIKRRVVRDVQEYIQGPLKMSLMQLFSIAERHIEMDETRSTQHRSNQLEKTTEKFSSQEENICEQLQYEEKVSTTIEENMFIEILKILSESAITNQYQLIEILISSDLFQSLTSKLVTRQPYNFQIFHYLSNIFNVVINAIPTSTNQKLDTYINWCHTELTKQKTSNEDNLVNQFKLQIEKINERKNSFQLQLPFINQFQHTCQLNSDLCYILVPKKYPNCQHIEYLPCHIEINQLKCKILTHHTLKCGHEITLQCHKLVEEEPKCQFIITHKFQDCGHFIEIPCSTDLTELKCSNNCDCRLKCGHSCPEKCHKKDKKEHTDIKCQKDCQRVICKQGHKCPRKCWEKCPDCVVMVNKARSCGHVIKHPCSKKIIVTEDAVKLTHKRYVAKCMEKCTRILDCSHPCKKVCSDRCGECEEIVDKQLECGHILKAACSIPIDKLTCDQPCDVILSCGHKCQNDCKNKCTDECTASVIVERSCGHEIIVSCHERNKPDIADPDDCAEPCKATLPCLHQCNGTCGQCRQGRLHVVCPVPCNKPLVCGHFCNHPCHSICPPCSQPCLTKCKHSKCWDICYQDCDNCIEKCEWKCQHFECHKLCHEMCDRPRCNEPCVKLLKCSHQCVGLCGEECPSLCRICNNKELTEFILSGVEDDENARFIQLVDCGHCIEVSAIDKWMDTQTEEIKMKECPRCKTTVWTSHRYGNVIRKQFQEIVKVTDKIFGDIDELKLKTKELVDYINRHPDVKLHFECEVETWLKILNVFGTWYFALLNSLRTSSCAFLNLIENQFNVLLSITKLKTKFEKLLRGQSAKYFNTQVKFLVCRLMDDKVVVNENTIGDIYKELTRIKFQAMIREDICQRFEYIPYYMRAKEILSSNSKFTDAEERKVQENLHEIFRRVPNYGLEISEAERVMIVKAVGLKPGHWYKCPNGHIYLITECGGAQVRGFCNECAAPIGGENHALDANNAHAGEMDGSSHPAWSNQTGLGNYLQLNN